MTADLAVITGHDDDTDAPVALWVDNDGAPVHYLTPARARQLTDQTRALLRQSGANLVELREGSAHLVLGYAHWHEYVEREFGDLFVYKLATGRAAIVAERQALVASMTVAGYTVREQRDALGASLGTIHADQRAQGLIPDRPLPTLVDEPPAADPFRGLSPIDESLARVAAQDDRGLTSVELQVELDRPIGTATASLSRLHRRGLVFIDAGLPLRANRGAYRITGAGRARLAVVLAARDAAEEPPTD